MTASDFVWNMEYRPGRQQQILLRADSSDGSSPTIYLIGEKSFNVLNLSMRGLSYSDIAELMSVSRETIRNQHQKLCVKFDVWGGNVPLLVKLVREGMLKIIPRVPEENWVGLRQGAQAV